MGRKIIITGTNRGIGKAILQRFAQEKNAYIIAHSRGSSKEAFLHMISEVESLNPSIRIEPIFFDLEDTEEIKRQMSVLLRKHMKIDVLVNNAGIVSQSTSFLMLNEKNLRQTFEINFFSHVFITQMVCRAMIRNKSGAIVNMASVAAFSGVEGQMEYTASKAAMVGMTRRLANELSVYNIRVNAVAPTMTDTDMMKQMDDEMKTKLVSRLVAKRMAKPDEIASVVYFLSCDEASYISGQTILVNRGGTTFDS